MAAEIPEIVVPTREGYDRWSRIYDHDGNPLVALEHPQFVRMMGDVRGLRVADVGTGTGRHAIHLARAGARVVAIDLSLGMMSQARAKAGADQIRFVCADCTAGLPLPEASFDRVVSGLVAEHVPSLENYFAELVRICRPGGFIIATSVHPAMHLVGVSARFHDPATGAKIYPAGYRHAISDYVMAARRAGLVFDEISEHVFPAEMIAQNPRGERYANWPMLLAMRLSRAAR